MFSVITIVVGIFIVLMIMSYVMGNKLEISIIPISIITSLSFAILLFFTYKNFSDVEILNGKIVEKVRHVEVCHEYSTCKNYTIHTRCTGSGDKQVCSTYKVFMFPYEVDWFLKSTVGTIEIERIDLQGVKEPKRWSIAYINEPASVMHSYLNPLLGNDNSVMYKIVYDNDGSLPEYPTTYDYYRYNRIIDMTSTVKNIQELNHQFNEIIKELGTSKQLNMLLVIYDDKETDFARKLIGYWRGGKKNDIIVMLGIDSAGKINRTYSYTFADNVDNVDLHSELGSKFNGKEIDSTLISELTNVANEKYNRYPSEKLQYIVDEIKPPFWVMCIIPVMAIIIAYLILNQVRRRLF